MVVVVVVAYVFCCLCYGYMLVDLDVIMCTLAERVEFVGVVCVCVFVTCPVASSHV